MCRKGFALEEQNLNTKDAETAEDTEALEPVEFASEGVRVRSSSYRNTDEYDHTRD